MARYRSTATGANQPRLGKFLKHLSARYIIKDRHLVYFWRIIIIFSMSSTVLGKVLLLKVMHYNIALLPKKVTVTCHKSSLCGSLRSPPEGSFTWVLTGSFGRRIPQPRAWDWSSIQVLVISRATVSWALSHLIAKSCFATADISERLPWVSLPVD